MKSTKEKLDVLYGGARYGSVVSSTRLRELWDVSTAMGGRNADKALSHDLECVSGELVVFRTKRKLNVKMKRNKNRCRLGVAIPDRLFLLQIYILFTCNIQVVVI